MSDKHTLDWYNDGCEVDDTDDDTSIFVDTDELIVGTTNII